MPRREGRVSGRSEDVWDERPLTLREPIIVWQPPFIVRMPSMTCHGCKACYRKSNSKDDISTVRLPRTPSRELCKDTESISKSRSMSSRLEMPSGESQWRGTVAHVSPKIPLLQGSVIFCTSYRRALISKFDALQSFDGVSDDGSCGSGGSRRGVQLYARSGW